MYANATHEVVRWLSSRWSVIAACAVLCVVPASASATEVPFGTSDTCQLINYPPEPCAGESELTVGQDDQGYRWHSLLKFDVSSIPSTADVNEATLRLYQSDESGGYPTAVDASAVASDWSSSGLYSFHWWTWTTPGGDFTGPSEQVEPNGIGQWTEFDVTDLVAGWVAGSADNYGVGLTMPGATVYEPYVVEFSDFELVVDYD